MTILFPKKTKNSGLSLTNHSDCKGNMGYLQAVLFYESQKKCPKR